jgi:Delta7-sterol 5-desaturase
MLRPMATQTLLHTLFPGPVLAPLLYGALLYGVRYLGLALALHGVARRGWGRPVDAAYPAGDDRAVHLRREIGNAAGTVLVFGLVNAVLFGTGLIQHTQLYFRIDSAPTGWFALSVGLALVLHDALFYALHRLMHTRALYRRTHLTHHRSVRPTAFAAYSFHPWEALAEALLVVAILFVLPMHPLALLAFQTVSTLINVYGHCGREFYPADWHRHPIGRWINTSTLHAHHHATGRDNYGLYFTWWDRWLGSLDPARR